MNNCQQVAALAGASLVKGASKHDLLCKFKRLFLFLFVSLAVFFTHLLLLKGELKLLTQG